MIYPTMSKTPGFSLLEILLAMMLATLVSAVVFNVFSQEHVVLRTVAEHEDIDLATAITLRQFAHDLAGTLQPIALVEQKKTAEQLQSASQKKIKREYKPLPRALVATEKNNQLDELTFITDNPLSRFVAPIPSALPKPQLVRVTYQLRDKKLLRSEMVITTQPSGTKKSEPIVVAENITGLVCSFVYTSSTEKEIKVLEQATWDSDLFFTALQKKEEKAKSDEKQPPPPLPKIPPLPSAVKIRLTLWDRLMQRQHSCSYLIPIPTAATAYATGILLLRPPERKQKAAPTMPPLAQLRKQGGGPPQILNKTPERAAQFQNLVIGLAKNMGRR